MKPVDHFGQMRRAFAAVGGEVQFHGETLLTLVDKISRLVVDGPGADLLPPILPTEPEPGLSRWETVEKMMMTHAIARHGGNVRAACAWLGVSHSVFYRRIELYGLGTRPHA